MISIEDIVREILKAEQQLSICTHHIADCRNEMLEAMDRAQRTFGDQQPGQYLVASLSEAMKELVCVDGSMYTLKSELEDYIRQLNK